MESKKFQPNTSSHLSSCTHATRELEGSLKAATPLSKLLKSILNGTYQHDNGSASGADDCAGDSVNGSEKHVKGIHELLHGAPNSSTAPGDLFLLAFYLTQVGSISTIFYFHSLRSNQRLFCFLFSPVRSACAAYRVHTNVRLW